MNLTYESAKSLVDGGQFGELRKLANPPLTQGFVLEPRLRVLVAHALVYTGESKAALSLLSTLDLESRSGDWSRWRARLVIGLANRAVGSMTKALGEFQRALHIAQESGTAADIAWAHIYLFRHLIEGHPVDLAPAMLPAVRAAVTRAGSSRASAFLHTCVAVLEGHNGRLNEASRHCECSESLESLAPNPWLACGNLQNRAAILLADCRFAEALTVLERLEKAATRHGLNHERAKAEANLGHLYAMLGEHDRALEILARVTTSPSVSRLSLFSVSEGMARAYLWKGDWDRCEEVLARIETATAGDEELASVYGVRWAAITRARLLLKRDEAFAAVKHLTEVERRYRGATDAPFSAAVCMFAAQALAHCGDSSAAARQLVFADRLGATSFRELQGQFYGAAASTLNGLHVGLSRSLRQRAKRVWDEQGTAWMGQHLAIQSSMREPDGPASAAEVVSALASAMDLAHNPRLLAQELVSVIRDLGCATEARPMVIRKDEQPNSKVDAQLLSLGTLDDATWHLECSPPSDPLSAIVLADVLRIGRAAVALERLKAVERNSAALWPVEQDITDDGALFLSQEMRDLVDTARRVAPTDIPVLITGETGTGKEVLARLIHARSARAKKVFLPFNCTTVPKDMMDSQLFGHRRGAFTGANDSFQGVVRGAKGGTLLLDEIGDLSLESQPKLLRFLESGDVLPLGETNPVHVDVRVLAATNSDLDVAVSEGRFREDLFYRLNIVRLRVPPLRERRIEIPSLARHYLRKFSSECQKGDLRLSDETMEYLVLFRWPGNVRQLSNEMRRLSALAERDAVLTPDQLSPEIERSRRTVSQQSPIADPNQIVVRLDQPMAAAVQCLERAMLRFAMHQHDGRVEIVAKALGLSRKGLYLKRQRYGATEVPT